MRKWIKFQNGELFVSNIDNQVLASVTLTYLILEISDVYEAVIYDRDCTTRVGFWYKNPEGAKKAIEKAFEHTTQPSVNE